MAGDNRRFSSGNEFADCAVRTLQIRGDGHVIHMAASYSAGNRQDKPGVEKYFLEVSFSGPEREGEILSGVAIYIEGPYERDMTDDEDRRASFEAGEESEVLMRIDRFLKGNGKVTTNRNGSVLEVSLG